MKLKEKRAGRFVSAAAVVDTVIATSQLNLEESHLWNTSGVFKVVSNSERD